MSERRFSIVSPGGSLGYGLNAESLERALNLDLDAIGADSGSTDAGGYYLGSGEAYHSRATMKRDIGLVLQAARSRRIPLLIGNAGLAGADPHLEWAHQIMLEVAEEQGLSFKLALIHAEQDGTYLKERLRAGKVTPMPGAPELDQARVDSCARIVAQMGMEPFIEALDESADVILAGRACDSAIFAAAAVRAGFDEGLSLHLGKILECGALSAVPPTGRDCLVADLREDRFEIVAPNPIRSVTPFSVAAHMVYEVENPHLQGEPTGTLDFSSVRFELTDRKSTIVTGTRFPKSENPTLRFEGAELAGYRSFLVGGIRDPFLIGQLDEYMDGCTEQTRALLGLGGNELQIDWIVYGRDGVMGEMEPLRHQTGHEVGIVAQILAPTQEAAHDAAALLEARMIGFDYTGSKTRTANFAFPFSPVVQDTGAVYAFSILHIVELVSPRDLTGLFPIEYSQVGSKTAIK
jgi:hypothetical protein